MTPGQPSSPTGNPSPAPVCLNCGSGLGQPRPHFCPACGQETRLRAPTLREFAQQLGGAYFSTEGALWRTLKVLLLQPGELTRQYLAGRRKHYVLPLRLYLTISLIALLGLRLSPQGDVKIQSAGAPDAVAGTPLSFVLLDAGRWRVGLNEGRFYCESLPPWLCRRLQHRIGLGPQAIADEVASFGDRFVGHLGGAMFVLLPSFALWLALVYRNRRMRYTEHLVFALHVHAFWFFALLFTLPGWEWLSAPALLAMPWYTLAAMRRVYGGGRWPRLLRAAVVATLYLVAMGLALAVLAAWTLVF
ncbi:MAG TPA: DUF3667 domain-containing protein [Caldimonas sp.]|jgi:predicted RNA-binding Zn-ribbon protein involved in translation (DUF1610 family)|nr:DUF3667 domain-containing protein [Caldimonas sp.]HEX4233985.1 DUF3667 domain-containing protein [Caldimonas sp.]